MIARRELLLWALWPLGLVGGAALRLHERAMASKIVPQKYRRQSIQYFWTDGSGRSGSSLHDAPDDAKAYLIWPGADRVARLGGGPVSPEAERIAREKWGVG